LGVEYDKNRIGIGIGVRIGGRGRRRGRLGDASLPIDRIRIRFSRKDAKPQSKGTSAVFLLPIRRSMFGVCFCLVVPWSMVRSAIEHWIVPFPLYIESGKKEHTGSRVHTGTPPASPKGGDCSIFVENHGGISLTVYPAMSHNGVAGLTRFSPIYRTPKPLA
jgi:hypothetical protein